MTWLKDHVLNFAIPGIRTLARADGRAILDDAIHPFDGIVRPSTKCPYEEAGLLYATVASILKKSDPLREVTLGLCRTVGQPADSQFVYELDSANRVKNLGAHYEGVEGADVLHSFICNSIRALHKHSKDSERTLVYPGRDVWCWEVLSQKNKMPTVYDPVVSRTVAGNDKALKKTMKRWDLPDVNKMLVFDTGYKGSVPTAIGKAAGLDRVDMILLSAVLSGNQIFPGHTGSRAKALAFEYLAKYRKRGTHQDGEPVQYLAGLEEFIKATLLTIWLWHHVSPRKLPSWKEPDSKLIKRGGMQVLKIPPCKAGTGHTWVNNQPITVNATAGWSWANAGTTSITSTSTIDPGWITTTSSNLVWQ